MGFTEALEVATATRRPQNRVDAVLAALDPEDRERCLAALRDRAVASKHIGLALTAIGHKVSESAVRRWRERNDVR